MLNIQKSKKKYAFIWWFQKKAVPLQRQFLHIMEKKLFLLLFTGVFSLAVSAMSTLDSLFAIYDAEVARSEFYIDAHQKRIDSLRHIKPMTKELQVRIAREYQYFQSDSARAWYLRMVNAEEPYRTQAYMGLVQLSSSIGKYGDGMELISLVTDDMPDSLRVDWVEAIWRLHNEALASSTVPQLQKQLAATTAMYYDSLLHEMARQAPYSDAIRLRYEFLQALDADNIPEALRVNDTILSRLVPWSHRYAIETYSRYNLYEQAGNNWEKIAWLVRSAISDARCGITDNGSSWLIAKECYAAGDLERAYAYSDYSLTNLSIALIALAVFLIFLIGAVFFSLRQNRKLQALNRDMKTMNEELRTINRQLKEADKVKEQYICRYLEVYSDYIRRLTTMARKAGEKDSAAFMDREMENFYRSFDDTFLSLYGTFVQDFNALLKPEARITPKPGERMTVEMRIFALILLGITSSAKIAELLCYSPNTISNYRVKMKNAALEDRDSFEQRVRLIGTPASNRF